MKKLLLLFTLSFSLFTAYAQVVLYGLTSEGGANNVGTIFSVTPAGNLQVFVNLNTTYAGGAQGSLLFASDSNFYASSGLGGYNDSCTIFRCTPDNILNTMINLDTAWGSEASPFGENDIIEAKDGNLYGMTTYGGGGYGVLYQLQFSGTYQALHFFNYNDGAYPYGRLLQTEDGMLWGMTGQAGANGYGNIFKCTTSGVLTSVFNFNDSDGGYPHGDLCLASDGNFYGITYWGGLYNRGVLFRYTPSGTFTKLVDFNDTNGANPFGSLIQASNGNLYGLTYNGGDSNAGTLFECTLSGSLTTLISFYDTIGVSPYGSLIQASDGFLYGMTNQGGNDNSGTIFQYSLSGSFKKIAEFNGINGANPTYGRLIEVDHLPTGLSKLQADNEDVRLYPNPNNGIFTIQSSLQGSAKQSLQIYNMLGKEVFSQLSIVNFPLSIDLTGQSSGVYLYRVISEDGGLVGEGKVIVQK